VRQVYIKQSVILNYPLSSVMTKHAVDVASPTHCPRLPAAETPSTAHSLPYPTRTIALLPLQCHYV